MATAALVLGILSIVLIVVPGFNYLAMITAIIGVILGAISLKTLKAEGNPTGVAMGGLVTSIIGLSLSALLYISCFICAAGASCIASQYLCSAAKSAKESKIDINVKGRQVTAPQESHRKGK